MKTWSKIRKAGTVLLLKKNEDIRLLENIENTNGKHIVEQI